MRLSSMAGLAALVTGAAALAQTDSTHVGAPLGSVNEKGVFMPLSSNVKVYGSVRFTESCTFDPERNLILAMNLGVREELQKNDGYVSLIKPDGSVHTAKWIGADRKDLTLNDPLGSAISKGVLYTVDQNVLRSFDLKSGRPLKSVEVPGATLLNGIGVAADGTAYISNTRAPERLYKVTADGRSSVLVEGRPLNVPNGVAIDRDGNIVVVNVGDNAVLTFSPAGKLLATEHAVEGGNDGVVITEDGTKYVSSVRFGSVSRIRRGEPAQIIASGIPSAASMCYDSIQRQLVIPMNPNDALAFIPLAARPSSAHVMIPADGLKWGDAPAALPKGAKLAVLVGDPAKPGPFVIRLQLPQGFTVSPHWHPADENATVLSGKLALGMGEKFDKAAMKMISAGGYAVLPAGMRHYAMAVEPTTIQVHSVGPFTVNYVNPADDPRKK